MTIDAQLGLALVVALIGGIGWLVRLESRISRAEERHRELRTDHREIKAAHYALADAFREAFGGQFKILRLPRTEARPDDPD